MFYFLLTPIMMYNFILIAAAMVPAVFLMIKVYRSDRLERESPRYLRYLATGGVLSSLIAMVAEKLLSLVLNITVSPNTALYNVLLYFGIVAFSEEGAKYFMLKRRSWKSSEFDCLYDGVVYAVFVALGFALWENISYVMAYGFSTAIVRAVTAIPGHACFGVFMGVFYGVAKMHDRMGNEGTSKAYRVLAVVVPAVIHGAYDYIATAQTNGYNWYFIIFIAVLFVVSFMLVGRMAKNDKYIA